MIEKSNTSNVVWWWPILCVDSPELVFHGSGPHNLKSRRDLVYLCGFGDLVFVDSCWVRCHRLDLLGYRSFDLDVRFVVDLGSQSVAEYSGDSCQIQ